MNAAPSSARWLAPEALDPLLARIADEAELVGPVEIEGEVVFVPVRGPQELCRDYVNSLVPPKEYLLPAAERLLAYAVAGGEPTLEPPPATPERERVLFGVRACDVAGMAYLERYFSGELFGRPDTADAPFQRRRAATTVISVTCERPGPTCMCVCCAGGPSLERGYDWQLTRLERGWLVEIGSERGAALARRHEAWLGVAPPGAIEEKRARVHATVERFRAANPHRVPTMAATRMVSAGRLDEAFWASVGDRCFECGGCAYVCPTCWCFNVVDVPGVGEAPFPDSPGTEVPMVPGGPTSAVRDGRYERIRLRDNCQLAGFVRQAGGNYPRWTCGERCLTRFFHKLSEQFKERMGAPGCTGCGRCIVTCLGERGIDRVAEGMRDVLTGPGRASRVPLKPAAATAREQVTP